MKNYVQNGETIVVPAPSDTVSGAFVVVGALRGVAVTDALSGADCPIVTEGVFTLPKATGAISVGDKLYWDSGAGKLTKTSAGNVLVGVCVTAALSGDANVAAYISLEMAAAETGTIGAAVADVATADGSDAGTTQTLANALKVKVNAILASLRTAGVIAP